MGERRYWASVQKVPPRKLIFAEPVVSDGQYLRWLFAEYLPYFIIAIPLLLPLWFVVHRGLLPPRTLATRIATRDPADVSPLGLRLRHAELKPLGNAFDKLLQKVRHSLERERSFVLDAPHELRTPLAVITAQAHALVESDGAAQREARSALERAVERASHLTHQLLTLSSLEATDQAPVTRVDLVELTRQVLIDHTALATKRDIALSLDSPEHLTGMTSRESFQRVLDDLLVNSLTYGVPGGRVELTLRRSGERVQLDVRDDGPGVSDADRPKLFERFRRGQDVNVSGTGLGLAIVRSATNAMRGTVTLGPGLDGRGIGFEVVIDFPQEPTE